MKAKKQGLQKFTESEIKINALLELEQITEKDKDILTDAEKIQFGEVVTKKLNGLKGQERDELLKKVELITTESTKNQLWENNHIQITSAISKLMQDFGCMPTKSHLATETGLSRQTITKHIKEYQAHPQYLLEMEQFRFMGSKVLAKVFKFAVNGDIRAARLYLEMIGMNNGQPLNATLIQQQNNYIQINRTVLSQDNIKQLTPEQLEQIEQVIKLALPELALGDK